MEEVLIPIAMFATMGLIAWKYFDTRHKERMSVIEAGLVGEELKFLFGRQVQKTGRFLALKLGLLALFIGIGIIIAILLGAYQPFYRDELMTGCVILFGGLGLILYYPIATKEEQKIAQNEALVRQKPRPE
jgi:Domain of unknown function (DUF6249)